MTINNITGTNSLRSNCQPDSSTSILTNIHDFISGYEEHIPDAINISNTEVKLVSDDDDKSFVESQSEIDFEAMIVFDTEVDDNISSTIVAQAPMISNDCVRICQKIMKRTSCDDCRENFDLMDRGAALLSVHKLLSDLNKTIAAICTQESIKKKLLISVQQVKVHVIGCSDHSDEVERKIKILAVDHILLTFCNNINKILSGKIDILPDKPSIIQKLAFEHRVKKRGIGKHSDKFN